MNPPRTQRSDARVRLSRRGFLKAAGATAGATAVSAGAGVIPFKLSRAAAQGAWDFEYDVVVAGTGGAAFSATATAFELGNSVVMLEKGAYIGGTTYVSGGGHWTPLNKYQKEAGIEDSRDLALQYMAHLAYPQFYNPEAEQFGLPDLEYSLLVAYVDNAAPAVDFLEAAGAMQSTIQMNWDRANPVPQVDYFDHFPENNGIRGRLIQPLTPEGTAAGGSEMIRQYTAYAEAKGIEILLGHRVDRLVVNDNGEVVGVEVTILPIGDDATPVAESGTVVTFRARKGVVFGTGGFSKNYEMMRQFMPGPIIGGCGAITNEGDFVRIATALGAKLGGMQYAWLQQSRFELALENLDASNCIPFVSGDSMFIVNRTGVRVVNEKRNYNDRPRAHFTWNANTGDWENRLLVIVYDERTAQNWAGFNPFPPMDAEAPFVVHGDTWEALAAAIEERFATLAPHTGGFSTSADFAANLTATAERFNQFATAGKDDDFQRGEFLYDLEWPFPPTNPELVWPSADQVNRAMYPLSESGPYHAIILSAGVFDTNGGPMTNDRAQVIDWDNNPIPGLYGVGNCVASVTHGAYCGGGQTLGTATTFGYIAGTNINNEPVKEA